MTMQVSDLKIIITGGASGIGAATGRMLAEGGAQVMLADVQDAEGEKLAAELGDKVIYRHLDVTSSDDWEAAVAAAESAFGEVNALFNNAGIVGPGTVAAGTPESFDKTIDINLRGVYRGLHFAAPAIKRAGGGAIVNTSSTAGLQGYAGLAAYTASKWGVRGLTKSAALELGPDNVRVVSLHPGPIHTPMTESYDDSAVAGQPIKRFGEPDEVARMVRFLLTEATYSTGSEFAVDGGATAGQIA
ncbi:SDR family oxidoreductase [Pseudoroseicyclus sp. H15]